MDDQPNLFGETPEGEPERRIRVRDEFAARMRDAFTHADVNPLAEAGWDPELDKVRLKGQMKAVAQCLGNGEWWTLSMLATASGGSEAGVSARIRDLRKRRYGAHTIEKRRLRAAGTWTYRLIPRSGDPATPSTASPGTASRTNGSPPTGSASGRET